MTPLKVDGTLIYVGRKLVALWAKPVQGKMVWDFHVDHLQTGKLAQLATPIGCLVVCWRK